MNTDSDRSSVLAMSPYRVFISYRRADSWGWAGRIYDRLCESFGEDHVFMDVEELEAGSEYVHVILDVVTHADAILVVIGTRWLSETAADGRRRIDIEDDLVRREVATALSRDVVTLPLLVEGASMPSRDELPDPLATLAAITAHDVRPNRFGADVADLCERVRRILDDAERKRQRPISEEIEDLERQKAAIEERILAKKAALKAQTSAADRQFRSEIASGRPTVDPRGTIERPFDAFLLYSHAHDALLAASIQKGLQDFARPWYALRSVRIFRDTANLAATPQLWTAITDALEKSKYVILLASPEAARSRWVEQELSYWLAHRSADEILLVLSGGEIVWDVGTNDFNWQQTTALPSILRGAFSGEPFWLDVRWLQSAEELTPANPRFHNMIASLAAGVLGIAKEDLVARHSLARRRLILTVGIIMATLGVAAIVALLATN